MHRQRAEADVPSILSVAALLAVAGDMPSR